MAQSAKPIMSKSEVNGEWVITQIREEAQFTDLPFEAWDEWALRQPFDSFLLNSASSPADYLISSGFTVSRSDTRCQRDRTFHRHIHRL